MKNKMMLLLLTALIAMAINTSCNSPEKNTEKVQANNTDTTNSGMVTDTMGQAKQDWEKFKTDAHEKLRENSDSLATLKDKMDKAGKKMHAKFDKKIEELKKKNEELNTRLDKFQEEGKENWEKFKRDFNNDMDTLSMKWNKLTKTEKKG